MGERGGQRAPCNICGVEAKFETGGLVVRDRNGWLYFVGPDCARKSYNDFHLSEREFKSIEDNNRATTFLFELLPKIPALIAYCRQLEILAEEADNCNLQILSVGSEFCRALVDAISENSLTVDDSEQVMGADGSTVTRRFRRRVASISGQLAVRGPSRLLPALARITNQLRQLRYRDEAEMLERLAAIESTGDLVKTRKFIDKTLQSLRDLRDQIRQHRAFYSASNFGMLQAWNDHQLGPGCFAIETRANVRTIKQPSGDRVWLSLRALIQEMPIAPEF